MQRYKKIKSNTCEHKTNEIHYIFRAKTFKYFGDNLIGACIIKKIFLAVGM